MRENCTYGSEGGEAEAFPTPIRGIIHPPAPPSPPASPSASRAGYRSLISREIYGWLRMTPAETLTDIQRAARFYYLQKMSFGGKIEGQTFGTVTKSPPKLNPLHHDWLPHSPRAWLGRG